MRKCQGRLNRSFIRDCNVDLTSIYTIVTVVDYEFSVYNAINLWHCKMVSHGICMSVFIQIIKMQLFYISLFIQLSHSCITVIVNNITGLRWINANLSSWVHSRVLKNVCFFLTVIAQSIKKKKQLIIDVWNRSVALLNENVKTLKIWTCSMFLKTFSEFERGEILSITTKKLND